MEPSYPSITKIGRCIKSYRDKFSKLPSSVDLSKESGKKISSHIRNLHERLLYTTDDKEILKLKQLLEESKSNDTIRNA